MQDDLQKVREFAVRYTAAWCSHDPMSVAACYSPTGSLTINNGSPTVGRGAITEAARAFMIELPNLLVTMDYVVVGDEGAEYHWTLTGNTTGPGGKGHKIRISGYERWQMTTDGLIASSQGHFDATEYQRQIEHGFQ